MDGHAHPAPHAHRAGTLPHVGTALRALCDRDRERGGFCAYFRADRELSRGYSGQLRDAGRPAEGNGYRIAREIRLPADRPSVAARIAALRARFGYQDCKGDGVFFYDSGMVTFPLLGTAAPIEEKLRFDPDRGKRRRMLPAVREAFPEYTVALAGSSSFDIMPRAFDKARALGEYAAERGILKREVLFIGDDLGEGGGDRPVLEAGFPCFAVQDYRELPARLAFLTEALGRKRKYWRTARRFRRCAATGPLKGILKRPSCGTRIPASGSPSCSKPPKSCSASGRKCSISNVRRSFPDCSQRATRTYCRLIT